MSLSEVLLVQMPYVALQVPSIALSILQSALDRPDIGCQVGDWIFAGAAFPHQSSHAEASLDTNLLVGSAAHLQRQRYGGPVALF